MASPRELHDHAGCMITAQRRRRASTDPVGPARPQRPAPAAGRRWSGWSRSPSPVGYLGAGPVDGAELRRVVRAVAADPLGLAAALAAYAAAFGLRTWAWLRVLPGLSARPGLGGAARLPARQPRAAAAARRGAAPGQRGAAHRPRLGPGDRLDASPCGPPTCSPSSRSPLVAAPGAGPRRRRRRWASSSRRGRRWSRCSAPGWSGRAARRATASGSPAPGSPPPRSRPGCSRRRWSGRSPGSPARRSRPPRRSASPRSPSPRRRWPSRRAASGRTRRPRPPRWSALGVDPGHGLRRRADDACGQDGVRARASAASPWSSRHRVLGPAAAAPRSVRPARRRCRSPPTRRSS